MSTDAQTRLPTGPERPLFATDEQILQRVTQAENNVADLQYRAGVLDRELADIRRELHPEAPAG